MLDKEVSSLPRLLRAARQDKASLAGRYCRVIVIHYY